MRLLRRSAPATRLTSLPIVLNKLLIIIIYGPLTSQILIKP